VALILCEGEKTEPKYFKALRKKRALTTVEVVIADDNDSAPISVVNAAQEHQRRRKREARTDQTITEFDEIWCVVDVEVPEHESLGRAIDKAHQLIQTLDPKTDTAIENAKALFAQQWHTEKNLRQCNPCTEAYKLVERLREIAEKTGLAATVRQFLPPPGRRGMLYWLDNHNPETNLDDPCHAIFCPFASDCLSASLTSFGAGRRLASVAWARW